MKSEMKVKLQPTPQKYKGFWKILCTNNKLPEKLKQSWEKNNKAGDVTFPYFKLYYKTIGIKIVWYWHKKRHKDLWNRIGSTEINPHLHG